MLTLWLVTGIVGKVSEQKGLTASKRRRGRVGRLDRELREELAQEAAREAARVIPAVLPEIELPLPDMGLVEYKVALSKQTIEAATDEVLRAVEARAAQEREELARLEAIRIAEEQDEEDAIEAFLLAA